MSVAPSRRRFLPTTADTTVSPLELYFDLVFVFALTQVTAMMADDLTPRGVLRGMLVLALLWWSWVGYAWLCNLVRTDSGPIRMVLFLAMTAMFVLALGIPEAFDDRPGGLPGPIVVALCYFAFRFMHLTIFWLISADDPVLRRQIIRFTPSVLGGTFLLVLAGRFDGVAQTLLWAAALTADYVGTLLAGASGWRLRSPGHFAERHGLILIVALGESIVAIGVGVEALPISVPIITAAVLGLTVASALWWTYFDMSALHAEHAFVAEPDETRTRFARDAYSFLHLPLLAGVVLTALGMKKVLEYVGDTDHHELSDPLSGMALVALTGGVVLYLLGHIGFTWRTSRKLMMSRVAAAVAVTVLLVAGAALPTVPPLSALPPLPALVVLAVLAVILVAMVAYETARYADDREALHGHV